LSYSDEDTAQLQKLVARSNRGDAEARAALLSAAYDRLRRLSRKMFRGFPKLRQWEETDDVWQGAALRLDKALQSCPPGDVAEFFGLAARQIRWQLLDLARRHAGQLEPSQGLRNQNSEGSTLDAREPASDTNDPQLIDRWTEFHRQVEQLPDDQRQVADLLYYAGLKQEDAARLLQVSVRTVKSRWQAARLALYDALAGQLPI